MKYEDLESYLAHMLGETDLSRLIERIASACWSTAHLVRDAALQGNSGTAGSINPQGEDQRSLDVLADQTFRQSCEGHSSLAALVSEEVEEITWLKTPQAGDLVLSYDPLDGSSNIDVGLSVGSIFSVSCLASASSAAVLPNGHDILCSGYAIYGPSTMLVLTFGQRVDGFTLDVEADTFLLTHPDMKVPRTASEFAINMSRHGHWDSETQAYIAECIQGEAGPRAKSFNMRWTASMVADVHRILVRGGVFLYPLDADNAATGGKLRLLYEAIPMAMIIEAAGGAATNGKSPILDLVPQDHHQRTGVVLGAKDEVGRLAASYV